MVPSLFPPSASPRTRTKDADGHLSSEDMEHESHRQLGGEREGGLRGAFKASVVRTTSEDRTSINNDHESKSKSRKDKKHDEKIGKDGQSKSSAKSGGPSLFNTSRTNDGFGISKAGRNFFGKLTRSGSSTEKASHGIEEEYEPRVLKLPLVQQTRETRIAKSYDTCRDKTEFWMPALPWRCIDYLNGKCEEEGLYRVSGGLNNIRRWRRRFDTEYDINLLDESDLYDASVIASLFKEWIRELPEEIFPKALQQKIAGALPPEVPGKKPVPQALRDELSNLPPFNYYLLFAITCHLSLLLSHESKNKMTLDNLYRCFNQSLKLDGRIFYTLVGDWRQCWQGCYTENEFLRAEYEYLKTPFPEFPDLERRPAAVDPGSEDHANSLSAGNAVSDTEGSISEYAPPATASIQPAPSAVDTQMEARSPRS